MKDAPGHLVQGRTRWRRFAAVSVPAVALAGAIVFGMANGAIAASFAVSGSKFKVSADRLDGFGFVQYGGSVSEKGADPKNPRDPRHHLVAVSAIKTATLVNLCQSVAPEGLPATLMIRAGQPGSPKVEAENLLINMTELSGNAEFDNINIGQDASTLDAAGPDAHGLDGSFGQQADEVHITNLHQVAWSTTAGKFKLNGLSLSLSFSKEECFK